MTATLAGLFAGILLALVAVLGGLDAFLLAVVLGAIGLGVGLLLDGRIDLGGISSSRRRG